MKTCRFISLYHGFFENIAQNKIKQRTQDNYMRVLDTFVIPTFRNVKLKDITAARLDTLFADLSKAGSVAEFVQLKEGSPLPEWIKNRMVKTAQEMGVSDVALRRAAKGETLRAATAEKIAAHYDKRLMELFEPLSTDKALAPSYVHSVVTALSSIFQSAYKAGIIKENPVRRTTPPPPASKAIEGAFLDEEQARRFLAILDDMPQGTYRTAFFVLLYVGLRSGELRALHWQDIDFENGVLYVRHGLYEKKGEITLTAPKNKSSIRALKLPQDIIDILTEYKQWQDQQAAALGSRWEDNGIVFANTSGKYLDGQSLNKKLKSVIAGHDLPDIHVHSLRHTTASLLINNHETAATVSAQLGHSSIDTTNRVYVHSFKSAQAAAAEGLQTLLRKQATNEFDE